MPLLRPHHVEIELALDRAEVGPGDVLGATVIAGGPDAGKLSELVVELGYTGEYDYKVEAPARAGDLLEPIDSHSPRAAPPVSEHVGTADVVVAAAALPTEAGRYELELELPADAPGSGRELASWWVRARAIRRRGEPITANTPLEVRCPAPERDPAEQWHEGDGICEVELRLDEKRVLAGGRLSGTVILTPLEESKPATVSLGLERRRSSFPEGTEPSGPWLRRIESADAARGAALTVGQVEEFSFSLPVPTGLPPTGAARDSAITYELQAFVSYGFTANDVVRREVLVDTATS